MKLSRNDPVCYQYIFVLIFLYMVYFNKIIFYYIIFYIIFTNIK